jgi:outer membrane lipoprotein-sorting protein
MIKILAIVLAGALATLSLSGCTGKGEDSAAESGE